MYNHEIKERFLNEHYPGGNVSKQVSVFNKLEESENAACKDIAEMSCAEATAAILYAKIVRKNSLEVLKSLMNLYVRWCRENKVFDNVTGGILDVKISAEDVSGAISDKFFKDEDDLLNSMRTVRQFDDGRADVIMTALAWIGVQFSQIKLLRDEDVNLEQRKIYSIDGSVIVDGFSDDILYLFHQYEKCNISERSQKHSSTDVIKDRSVTTYIKMMRKRGSKFFGKPLTDKNFRSYYEDLNDDYRDKGFESRFTYKNIFDSGCLFRLWQAELSGLDVFDKSNSALVEGVFKNSAKYRNILWLYESYKKAFNL